MLALACGPHRPAAKEAAPATTRPPNILLVLTDDQDLLLGSLDVMPQVRSLLAERGATFTHAFVPLSLCCPSRASILTGQFPHNHGVTANNPPEGGFEAFHRLGRESSTIATALHERGYRTALMGKYLNGFPDGVDPTYVPPGWDEWDVPVAGNPYAGFGYSLNENGRLSEFGREANDYLTDVLLKRARKFIAAATHRATPFFLVVATYAPHRPQIPAPRHLGHFANLQAPRTASFDEADVSDKPAWVRRLPRLDATEQRNLDRFFRRRMESLLAVDELVGGLIQMLERRGALDQTYIVFTSDNGYHLGQHRLPAGKYSAYEEDIRVPLLVRGPGVAPGSTVDALVENIDFAPTFAEIAGAHLRHAVDGRSLLPWLTGKGRAESWRSAVFLEQFSFREDAPAPGSANEPVGDGGVTRSDRSPPFFGLRTTTHKYIEYGDGEREYYDLARDPGELDNLAASLPADLQARLSERVRKLAGCAGDACRELDAVPPDLK